MVAAYREVRAESTASTRRRYRIRNWRKSTSVASGAATFGVAGSPVWSELEACGFVIEPDPTSQRRDARQRGVLSMTKSMPRLPQVVSEFDAITCGRVDTTAERRLRGGQRRYSNLAIRTALTLAGRRRLELLFGLHCRARRMPDFVQTKGFLDSLLSLMSRDLKAPDDTTLSRRNQIVVSAAPWLPPSTLTRAHDGPIDLIVESTGLKIPGSRRMERSSCTSTRHQRNPGRSSVS